MANVSVATTVFRYKFEQIYYYYYILVRRGAGTTRMNEQQKTTGERMDENGCKI